eukprot:CAMPEP_0115871066 /NCGR_PEP_ID=MMETSP0287-20121206/22668_1 /TAXON_ID=412157 /ORGANISM="Chrysochromulina rotalis, Strain UIO044" /LENGTH=85 /DNA_ID=CAMNT_0003325843 /DNA_START=34 /DNA_END=287 /DNA_ORIENTATION=+
MRLHLACVAAQEAKNYATPSSHAKHCWATLLRVIAHDVDLRCHSAINSAACLKPPVHAPQPATIFCDVLARPAELHVGVDVDGRL